MDILTIVQIVQGICWFAIIVWFGGSFFRDVRDLTCPNDEKWSTLWMVAALFMLWRIKSFIGITEPKTTFADYQATLALNILAILLALHIMFRRWKNEGWRW